MYKDRHEYIAHRYKILANSKPKKPGFLKIKTQNPFRLRQESGFLPTLAFLLLDKGKPGMLSCVSPSHNQDIEQGTETPVESS
jgi:hypothetical protein